ncbi:arrestin [Histoplasma capsulatum var. duboisii H88]|uniref:Arrestin n=1 Tax=Ajellomyces capsulatus (strain H88) TaxID=544711 RepID=F0UHC7_AJEC8|nr:arrestin [Histoplasma capsulatum var. duboisii H88]QSS55249.1 arrestin [Histoplasma capsulatum var. duboisii H88]
MPGRLIPNFVWASAGLSPPAFSSLLHEHNDRDTIGSALSSYSRSSTASLNNHSRPQSPVPDASERRLSFSMDHLIHPNRNREHKEKRRSLIHLRPLDKSSGSHLPATSLDITIESPPLVLYGPPSRSTGALMSGRILLTVSDGTGQVTLKALRMCLTRKVSTKKPISRDCPACKAQIDELTSWEFLREPAHLKSGIHDYPFSYLFAGNLQPTVQGSLGSVAYNLSALAVTATGQELRLNKPIKIKRAIMPGPDRSSMRIFPPTNLIGQAIIPSVIYPIGNFPIQFTLRGVVEKKDEGHIRWRLRKTMWRIEEHQCIISHGCPKHSHKVAEGKGILHQTTRIIGHGEERSGWKSDFETTGGEIHMEFEANIRPGADPLCNVSPTSDGGLEVKHDIVIEQIVSEEFCPDSHSRLPAPTGAARVLRMVFSLHVTERGGLGISWDEEMPPVYDDVPASPPGYVMPDRVACTVEDYTGSPLPLPDYEELEQLNVFDDSVYYRGNPGNASSQQASQRERVQRLTAEDLETDQQAMSEPSQDESVPDIAEGLLR